MSRGGATGLIVSGTGTGEAVDVRELQAAHSAAKNTPVLVGSGVTVDTLDELFPYAAGFIVGTHFKRDGDVSQPVDSERVATFMQPYTQLAE